MKSSLRKPDAAAEGGRGRVAVVGEGGSTPQTTGCKRYQMSCVRAAAGYELANTICSHGPGCKDTSCTSGKRSLPRYLLTGPVLPLWGSIGKYHTKQKIKIVRLTIEGARHAGVELSEL